MARSTTSLPALTERYDAARPHLPAPQLGWLSALRDKGLADLAATGLPGARTEAWRFTNLNRLRRADPRPVALAASAPEVPAQAGALAVDGYRAVLTGGAFRADLSDLAGLPKGVRIAGLAEVLSREPALVEPHLGRTIATAKLPLAALNTAYLADGLVVLLDDGVHLDRPLHLISVGIGGETMPMFHPRLLVVAGRDAQATVVESHVGDGEAGYFANPVTEIALAEGAVLRHYKLQAEGAAAFHLATTEVGLADRAQYESAVLQTGGRLARNELHVHLGGERAECRLYGAYLARGEQHLDNTTFIDHAVRRCTSRELYKGVLDGTSRGVFQGKILVRRDAQQTDGHQLNRALLLSRGAEIDSKPELEIYADDVKCSHGATAGELEEDALFYLRARGIDAATARAMLVEAFLTEALEPMSDAALRAAFLARVQDWLGEAA
ncbi:MAG: Fe-S cluster assembly protein SufD [Alphaproteobacteria bacterium]